MNAVVYDTVAQTTTTFSITYTDLLTGINNIIGTSYDDIMIANNNGDQFSGGDGNDILQGGAGRDFLSGGSGDDFLYGSVGADKIDGGSGADWISYASSAQAITVDLRLATAQISRGDAAGDVLTGVEWIIGTAYADVLIGNDNDENWFEGGTGADYIDGGFGNNDTVSYADSTAGITVNLARTAAQISAGTASGDVLKSSSASWVPIMRIV